MADVPVRGMLYMSAAGKGLGEAQWWNPSKAFDEAIRLTMQSEGITAGRVLGPNGKPAAGMNVIARISDRAVSTPQFGFLSEFRDVTDQTGKFTSTACLKRDLSCRSDPQRRWTVNPFEDVLSFSGKETHLKVQMEVGVAVSGRLLDPEGKPVVGAGISAIVDHQNGPGLGDDATDGTGHYQFRLPAGGAHIYINSVPDGFTYPPDIHLQIRPGQPDIQGLNFTLPRPSAKGAQRPPCLKRTSEAKETEEKTAAAKSYLRNQNKSPMQSQKAVRSC